MKHRYKQCAQPLLNTIFQKDDKANHTILRYSHKYEKGESEARCRGQFGCILKGEKHERWETHRKTRYDAKGGEKEAREKLDETRGHTCSKLNASWT